MMLSCNDRLPIGKEDVLGSAKPRIELEFDNIDGLEEPIGANPRCVKLGNDELLVGKNSSIVVEGNIPNSAKPDVEFDR